MALDSTQTVIGTSGHLYLAPIGTTAPTDATTALAAAWKELGYTDENGVAITPTEAHQDFKAWQSFYVIRRQITDRGLTIATALRQWNGPNFQLLFGGGTFTGTPGAFKFVPPDPSVVDQHALVIDVLDGTATYRWYFPGVMAIPGGDIPMNRGAMADLKVAFELMVQANANPFEVYGTDTAFSLT